MKHLQFYEGLDVDRLIWPASYSVLNIQSSAITVLEDFRKNQPALVSPDAPAMEVEASMRRDHIRLKVVIDEFERFLGLVTVNDLDSQEMLKMVAEGYPRHELKVRDFMHPRSSLRSFDYEELERATIQDVMETLQHSGQQHCLVVDQGCRAIRGVISAQDIASRIGLPLDTQNRSSFVNVFKAIYH